MKKELKKASFVKQLKDWTGDAALYELSEKVPYVKGETNFVVVSAADTFDHGPETYIFPADEKGEILNWREMKGSLGGVMDHVKALDKAGFLCYRPIK